jgi:hypothetical protein
MEDHDFEDTIDLVSSDDDMPIDATPAGLIDGESSSSDDGQSDQDMSDGSERGDEPHEVDAPDARNPGAPEPHSHKPSPTRRPSCKRLREGSSLPHGMQSSAEVDLVDPTS